MAQLHIDAVRHALEELKDIHSAALERFFPGHLDTCTEAKLYIQDKIPEERISFSVVV